MQKDPLLLASPFTDGLAKLQVAASYPDGQRQVYGRPVHGLQPDCPKPRGYGAPKPLQLAGVDGHAQSDVTRTIPAAVKPVHVELGTPSYECDLPTANALVKSKLMETGVLEWWENHRLLSLGRHPYRALELGHITHMIAVRHVILV